MNFRQDCQRRSPCLAISPPLLFALRSLLLSVGDKLSQRLAKRSDCSLMNEVGIFV